MAMRLEADFTVQFDNFDLNTIPYVTFTRRYPNNEADLDLKTHELIRRDGDVLTSARHKSKTITLDGYIVAPSRTSYEQSLDTLKYRTSAVERPLVLQQAGSNRRYTATKENLVDEPISGGKSHISLAFRCSDPFGRSGTQHVVNFDKSGNGNQTVKLGHQFTGTAPSEPVFNVTLNSGTGLTNAHMGIGNSNTGQQIQVTRNWSAGDVMRIDCDAKRVYINGVLSDYQGVFPSFAPGTSYLTFVDSFTTRDVSIQMVYTDQYL